MSDVRNLRFGVCDVCLKPICQCPKPAPPHALTREQVEHHADQINHCEPEYIADHVEMLVGNDAALRQAAARLREAAQNLTCEICKMDMQRALKGT